MSARDDRRMATARGAAAVVALAALMLALTWVVSLALERGFGAVGAGSSSLTWHPVPTAVQPAIPPTPPPRS